MEKYTHLMVNGHRKNLPLDEDIINYWLSSYIEQYNTMILEVPLKKLMDPSYSCVENNGVKIVTYTSILNNGYIALRIWEEDVVSSIRLDLILSSPLPMFPVLYSMEDAFGMYDGTYMLLDRKDDFKTIDYRSYP